VFHLGPIPVNLLSGENQWKEVVYERSAIMNYSGQSQTKAIPFPQSVSRGGKSRKSGLNRNKEGSVRKVNGKVYVDFKYLGERVREPSGLVWNEQNAKTVREQLDSIIVGIRSGSFRFAEVFPNSKKLEYFLEKEILLLGGKKAPEQVHFKDYARIWYDLLKDSGRVSERTLLGYRRHLELYLMPFFGELVFADFNKGVFDKFISWAKKQQLRKRPISNTTINKIFVPLKMICKDAAIEYDWGNSYNPFYGFKKLPESDPYEKISPFSTGEQGSLVAELPDHWKPYFQFAFRSGLRQGEQIGLKPGDIDWSKRLIHIRRAITLDENGKIIEGETKNRYSRRTIKLNQSMLAPLKLQKKIHERFGCEYFFCTSQGKRIHPSNLRQRIWIPTLKKAGSQIREMKQTRHSFATVALSCGENPLWIAKIMGHRNTDMIIKVYSRYVENEGGASDGARLDKAFQGAKGKDK
jgi:integrase